MKKSTYFPLGLAKNAAFCNRVLERNRLKSNIQAGRHSLVRSPRRYGKSSLILYVLNELKIPHMRLDLFVIIDEKHIETEIIGAVKKLINQLAGKSETAFRVIQDYIKKLKLKWIVGSNGINIEIIPDEKSDPAINIRSALLLLENFLAEKQQTAVLFIDEFQEVGIVAKNKGIEGAIRHVAQESRYLNIIFSGSNRHLLSQMFEDRTRPLYKLCDSLTLGRIHKENYVEFVQAIAVKTWKKTLPDLVLEKIFQFTELHPYYINVLCGRIWSIFTDTPPTHIQQIEKIWLEYIEEQKSDVAKELSFLSDLQKRLIINIALGNNIHLSGKINLIKLNSSSAAISKTLKLLQERDYIIQNMTGHYELIDPLIKASILLDHAVW